MSIEGRWSEALEHSLGGMVGDLFEHRPVLGLIFELRRQHFDHCRGLATVIETDNDPDLADALLRGEIACVGVVRL